MDFLASLKEFFKPSKNTDREEILIEREKSKSKFAFQLKNNLFMTDEEIKEVLKIIDESEKKVDEYQKNYDFSDITLIKTNEFGIGLTKIERQMIQDVKSKIKEIMDAKLARAKKRFDKE